MTNNDFNEYIAGVQKVLDRRMKEKGEQYTYDDNRFSNLEDTARMRDFSVPMTILNLKSKHESCIAMMAKRGLIPTESQALEYCGDIIIYMNLLIAYWHENR